MIRVRQSQKARSRTTPTRVRAKPVRGPGGPPGTANGPPSSHPARDWWVGRRPSPCERHDGRCAYTGQEPHRCPRCHRSWRAIVACECAGCRGNHRKWHDERDKATEEKAAQRRAARALREYVR
jgi:hypothetical protein